MREGIQGIREEERGGVERKYGGKTTKVQLLVQSNGVKSSALTTAAPE